MTAPPARAQRKGWKNMAKKNRMGKGLDMLFSDNISEEKPEQSTGRAGVTTVRLSLLEPNKDQPRESFDQEKLQELADSIKENGVLQPILVRPLENGGYQIVAGERRWRASRLAGLTEVPVFIKELDDRQTMQMALIENIQRQDLSPIEEAAAYKNLMDSYGMTQQALAEAVGKSRSAVANSLRLLELNDNVKRMVDDGTLSSGHAKILAGLDSESQVSCALKAEEEGMSVRELESYVQQLKTAEQQDSGPKAAALSRGRVRKVRPFLKEFELSVNANSSIRTKARDGRGGGAEITLSIGRELDAEKVLSKLAELLSQF